MSRPTRAPGKPRGGGRRRATTRGPSKAALPGRTGRAAPPARGEAGRRGEDVRSDLFASFEPRPRGGLEIALQSRVEPYYGGALREQAAETLRSLGVSHGGLVLEDFGALPFVVAARIEAAVRRSGGRFANRRALPRPVAGRPHPARDRLRRSRLSLPGFEPKYMINAGLHRPDGVILDLEDSVHPDEKDTSRILVRNALLAIDFGNAERMVRINQPPLATADLEEVVPAAPDLILIPKVEDPEEVAEVDRKIASIAEASGRHRPIWLMPILESAAGVERAHEIARASDRVVALTIGLEDYTADLGVIKTPEGTESAYARARLVNAARAVKVQAIDSVYGDVDDLDGLRNWAARARSLGFEGMGCVHPRQIPIIHRAFGYTAAEIEKATRIVEAFEEAQRRGLGVVSLGSKMIDPPVVQRALKLVERAKAMGLFPASGVGEEVR
jgi:citrate lyase subunit beta/citryl-CoA lyase